LFQTSSLAGQAAPLLESSGTIYSAGLALTKPLPDTDGSMQQPGRFSLHIKKAAETIPAATNQQV
jgi:hypothetical protein